MVVNNSDIEIIFQNTGSFIGRFVKSIRPTVFIDFISLSNKSFQNLTVVLVKFSVALRVYYSNVLRFISVSYLKCSSLLYELKEGTSKLRYDILFHVRN